MASQEAKRPLTTEELREIEECNKVIALHNLVVSGRHPAINLTPEQVSEVFLEYLRIKPNLTQLARHGSPPAPIEPVKVPESATSQRSQHLNH
jgi:hypothetical protein